MSRLVALLLALALAQQACGTNTLQSSGDAGTDAGDAGTDAGYDGGSDAGNDAGPGCALSADAGVPFGGAVLLSDPARVALSPAIASLGGVTVVAWHQFPLADAGSALPEVAYRVVRAGCIGPLTLLPDASPLQRWPALAASDAGFVLAYEASDGGDPGVRAQRLDGHGAPSGASELLSAPGALARLPDAAASGGDFAVAWTDGAQHLFALRGPGETTVASPIGFALKDPGLVNRPRVALDAAGTLFLGWSDGLQAGDLTLEAFLAVRPHGGHFGAATNLSNTPNETSAGVSLALEASGVLDVAWAEGAPGTQDVLEATYVTRSAGGALSSPARWGAQGKWVNAPSLAPGLAAAWTITIAQAGPLWFVPGLVAPQPALSSLSVFQDALARGPDGFHLVIADGSHPARVYYAWGSP